MDTMKKPETQPNQGVFSQKTAPVVVKKRSGWSTVAFLFLLLMVIAFGVAAWFWLMWQESENRFAANKTDLTNAQMQVANLREQLGVKNGAAEAVQNLPVNDEQAIKTAVKDYNAAFATPLADVKIELAKRDGNQAIATVAGAVAGYKVYLKKVENAWVVVWSGQNVPPADVVKQFDLKL